MAAWDAPDWIRENADFLCDGIDDDEELTAAGTLAESRREKLVLLGDTFNVSNETFGKLGVDDMSEATGQDTVAYEPHRDGFNGFDIDVSVTHGERQAIVVCRLRVPGTSEMVRVTGEARCHPHDTKDMKIGVALATGRALEKVAAMFLDVGNGLVDDAEYMRTNYPF